MPLPEAKERDWYEDHYDPRCPHDAWLNKLDFTIEGRNGDEQQCRKNLQIILLGAYHNGLITLTYQDVRQYHITLTRKEERPGMSWGRQDWLEDKVTILTPTLIEHRINWETEEWIIEAEKIDFRWARFTEQID